MMSEARDAATPAGAEAQTKRPWERPGARAAAG